MTTKKLGTDWRIVCFGIGCITVLEVAALYQGINGKVFSIVIAVIAGAIGVTIPNPFAKK